MQPHDYWQQIAEAGTFENDASTGFEQSYPVNLPDGRQLLLPIRPLAGTDHALASLIINQASFEVIDALATMLALRVRSFNPEIVIALPTLGLTLGDALARKLDHPRFVALGTSKKFWYDEELSIPMRSITSPDRAKNLYLDPRMIPLFDQKRILLVDDVISTGTSIAAACNLLGKIGIVPSCIAAAMLQTSRWQAKLSDDLHKRVMAVFKTPLLNKRADGRWMR